MHQLSNGRYQVRISPAGGGQSQWDWIALSRWAEDPVGDARGFFIYLRDLDLGEVWSSGWLPAGFVSGRYSVFAGEGRHLVEREDYGIVMKTEAVVSPGDDLEVRRVTLVNTSDRRRSLELTSYVEVALAHPLGDLGHPAFSKLFVQTERLQDGSGLVAKRRPRSEGESWPILFHALAGAEVLERETDRLRFIGRGRSLEGPAAMQSGAALTGTVGNVLDPILSLRTKVEIEAGGRAELSFILGAAKDQAGVEDLVARHRHAGDIARLFPRVTLQPVDVTDLKSKAKPVATEMGGVPAKEEPLQHFNGIGGFSADGSEYVMRLEWMGDALKLPPMPWINVLANPGFGCLISETGAGCTWSRNSQANRLTPWSNDPVIDPHDEAFYLRDEDSGAFWSPLPGPAPAAVPYETRHGQGWSRFSSQSHGLRQEVTVFVSCREPVKTVRIRLANDSGRARRLSVFGYQRLVLGSLPQTPCPIKTWRQGDVLCAENPGAGDFAGAIVFSLLVAEGLDARHMTCDRVSFLGAQGSTRSPAAMHELVLNGACGEGFDACFAQQALITLAPGQDFECSFVLGEAINTLHLDKLAARYCTPAAIEESFKDVAEFWRDTLSGVRVRTPVPEIDLMVNGWLAYQTLACRIYGRTAFYQSSGAFGFRDQLQDAGNVSLLWPDITRHQILLHARHQFREGDVLHWWHDEPMERGMRTRFSDDLLWLPLVVGQYVQSTGDASVLDEPATFLQAPELAAGQDENYLKPDVSGDSATVYEHCCRALDRSLTSGVHGLPLMGTGDWNDGMNRVGREGRGESVWLGFFLYQILGDFITLARKRGDETRAGRYAAYRATLLAALNGAGWDGGWYRRAYYDDGTPLGTASASECRIDGLAQAWSVISGAAPPDRAAHAMDAAEAWLVSEADGLIRLLTPPFVNTAEDPGYIKGYVAGVRENGGQYTHAACWVVAALAKLGRRDRAARLLAMLSPLWHTRTAARLECYKVEPYVIAADVYGAHPHIGRGGWTWYTGSAGWAWRVAIESVLGLSLVNGDTLVLKPCVPDDWSGFGIDYRHPASGTNYRIEVSNPDGCAECVVTASVDGCTCAIIEGAMHLAMQSDGGNHEVLVTLGGAG